ncbi:hypothetical protein [Corynebacterium oculi]|uniref:Tryptophan-rich sensory protein n=1 Tax=Corynebacterium oculi TaxID=1544416 RepID=A0A0Q0Z3J9_9CORY|nr:hypothetical protein [Corynebacterium oculi]KQB83900.1 hypothetical protein Cocul_01976 [Corynebacterium oculi]
MGPGVLVLAVTVLIRGVCYVPSMIPEGHRIPALERFLPLWSWSGLWLIAGALAVVCVVCGARRWLPVATGVLVALHTLWGAIYIAAWASGDSERGYVTALSYIAVALLATWAFGRGDLSPVVDREVGADDR